MDPLPWLSTIERYRDQAGDLLERQRAGDPAAIRFFHRHHPRFLDPEVAWKPADVPESVIADATLEPADAALAVARGYSFRDWDALVEHVAAVQVADSPTQRFERAVEAVIHGDLDPLDHLLRADPQLVDARSTRVTCHDPQVHGATLLHYVAANGVEGYRQRTPPDAVAIARRLLEGGARPDALACMYGGECTTLSLLVSSSHPAEAGLQVPLTHVLIDFGASVDGVGTSEWRSPLRTALVFGFTATAAALVARGARADTLVLAAGLGRTTDVARMLGAADEPDRHCALALAAQLGNTDVVQLLLAAGLDPNRHNPKGFHAHSTPLHQAALAGHLDTVRLLVESGASLDMRDTLWRGTPLGWARHAGQAAVARYLQDQRAAD